VAWQDEMNALDADVAAGRISAPEYRTQRDELLAGSGSGSAAGGSNPFPPPFRWGEHPQDGPQGPGAADRTQVVRGVPPVDSDRTQVVRGVPPADSDRTQVVNPDSNRTQVVRGVPPADSDRTQVVNPDSDRTQVVRAGALPPAQDFAPGSPPWQASPGPSGPPPPWRPGGTAPPWNTGEGFSPRQGPDSFQDFRAKPRGRKWLALVAAVVAAVVVIVAITYFALRGGGGGDTATAGLALTVEAGAPGPGGRWVACDAGVLSVPGDDVFLPWLQTYRSGEREEAALIAELLEDNTTFLDDEAVSGAVRTSGTGCATLRVRPLEPDKGGRSAAPV
jgi:hypothetical protein